MGITINAKGMSIITAKQRAAATPGLRPFLNKYIERVGLGYLALKITIRFQLLTS